MAEFISMTLGEASCRSAVFELKTELERKAIAPAEATQGQLIFPTLAALSGAGLHVDWNDGPIMATNLNWFLEWTGTQLSRYRSGSQDDERFAWEGDDVEDGFEAFAVWMRTHRDGLSLINYPTEDDTYFAAIVGTGVAEAAVAQLDLVGLQGGYVIKGTSLPTPSPVAVIDEVKEALDGHGFTASSERFGRFTKQLDDDYSLVLSVSQSPHPFAITQTPLYLQLGFANHTMNGLGRRTLHDERMVATYPSIGWVARSDDLNEGVLFGRTVSEWVHAVVHEFVESVVNEFTTSNIVAEFKTATKGPFGGDAKLLTLLMNRDWPKVCDKNYLRRWDARVSEAAQKNRSSAYTVWCGATADSVRSYLDEHDIAYGENR